METSPLVRFGELALKLGVTVRTVQRWRAEGMPVVPVGRGRFAVNEHAVREWLQSECDSVGRPVCRLVS